MDEQELYNLYLESLLAAFIRELIPQLRMMGELVRQTEIISAESSMDLYEGIDNFLDVINRVSAREATRER